MGPTARMLAVLQPALTVLFAATVAAVPWGASDAAQFTLPLVPLAVIHFWASRWSQLVPAPFVFGVGGMLDLVSSGPVGYWALLYLLGYGAGAFGPRPPVGFLIGWAWGATTLAAVAAAGWLVGSLYFLQPVSSTSIALGAIAAGVLYGAVMFVLAPVCPSIVEIYGPEFAMLEDI